MFIEVTVANRSKSELISVDSIHRVRPGADESHCFLEYKNDAKKADTVNASYADLRALLGVVRPIADGERDER